MIVLVVRWILKVTRFTSGILLGSRLILMRNMVLGVLSYHIMRFGRYIHPNVLHLTKHFLQIEILFRTFCICGFLWFFNNI